MKDELKTYKSLFFTFEKLVNNILAKKMLLYSLILVHRKEKNAQGTV